MGGVATFVRNLHDNFLRDGIKHNIIIRSDRDYKYKGMQMLETNILPYFYQMSRITRNSLILDSCNIFLEYPQFASNRKKFLIWNFLVKTKNLKWIKIFHDGTLPHRYKDFGCIEKFILRYSLKNIKKVLVVDDSIRKWLVREIGYKGKVRIIKSILPRDYKECHLPVDIMTFIQKYKYIICSIGTCKEEYGFQDIIAALAILPQEYKSSTGVILMDGNFAAKDKNYQVARNKFKGIENVLLLSKGVDNDMVQSIMRKSTVFVRGFFFESYGISRIEAILAGIPVIATNVGETRGMYIYEHGDIERLSQLILLVFTKNINADTEWINFYRKEAEDNYNLIKEEVVGS